MVPIAKNKAQTMPRWPQFHLIKIITSSLVTTTTAEKRYKRPMALSQPPCPQREINISSHKTTIMLRIVNPNSENINA